MTDKSFRFTHAITRRPAQSATEGLRAVDVGAPDVERLEADHEAYIAALRETGAEVMVLDSLEAFPDSVFVEDAALCLPEGAIVMRPGAESRRGEADEMAPVLQRFYSEIRRIEAPHFIEGGDILATETEILVGTSERTTQGGITALQEAVSDWGYTVRTVTTPPGVLHFKTDCSLLDGETILATKRLAASGCFENYRVLNVADGEEAAANAIRFNDLVLFPSGFPRTADMLRNAGYDVREIGNSEAAKLDGGMSCLSLRFSPPA